MECEYVDETLSFVLLTTATLSKGSNAGCLRWFNQAVDRVKQHVSHSDESVAESAISDGVPSPVREQQEESYRVFWLVYCLDRHLALAFNKPLQISDSEAQSVKRPLPEWAWEAFDTIPFGELPAPEYGPPTQIRGAGFFDYFLPLMTILGDIVDFRQLNHNPRLCALDRSSHLKAIEGELADCEQSLQVLQLPKGLFSMSPSENGIEPQTQTQLPGLGNTKATHASSELETQKLAQVVASYSQYMVHVLRTLLHGEWDPISILADDDGSWAPSSSFHVSTSSSVNSTHLIPDILRRDRYLSFMPLLFPIYLFQGSLAFLRLAERLVQVGPNSFVEQACELIIRSHEISIATLDTAFQVCDFEVSAIALTDHVLTCRETSARRSG